jgi:hypothetical protein
MQEANMRMFWGVTVQNVLSVKCSNDITIIIAIRGGCCLDT